MVNTKKMAKEQRKIKWERNLHISLQKKVNQTKIKTVMQEIRDKKAIRNGIQKTKSKMTKIPHQ